MAGPFFSDDIRRVLDSAALSGAAWARMRVGGGAGAGQVGERGGERCG